MRNVQLTLHDSLQHCLLLSLIHPAQQGGNPVRMLLKLQNKIP